MNAQLGNRPGRSFLLLLMTAIVTSVITLHGFPLRVRGAEGPSSVWDTFAVEDGILSASVLSTLVAQDGSLWFGTEAGASHYTGQWESITEREGLPAASVRAIAQTGDGSLWFATRSGLARRLAGADGANGAACCDVWTTGRGLPDNDVHSLLVADVAPTGAEAGGVWAGTAAGLVYIKGGRVIVDSPVEGGDVVSLAATPGGDLFAGVREAGIWQRGREGGWQRIDDGTLALGPRFPLWAGEDGRVWAGTQNGLVYRADGQWRSFPLTSDDRGLSVQAILPDDEGGLWVGTEQGVFYAEDFATGKLPVLHFRAGQDGLSNDYVRALAVDRDRAVWMGSIAGVSRYTGLLWKLRRDAPFGTDRLNALLVDSTGRLWAGSENTGLAVWQDGGWLHYTSANGLPDNRVISLFEDSAGRIWAGTGAAVGYWTETDGWRFFGASTPGLAGTPVYAMAEEGQGTLWLATDRGLSQWTEDGGFREVAELQGKRINAVYYAADGTLWLGMPSNGLLRLVDGRLEPVNEDGANLVTDVVVRGITETADGTLWVGTYNDGLWSHQNGLWQRNNAALPSPKLLSLAAEGDGLWVGTRQGLAHSDGATWQNYNGDVLPAAWVTALAPAGQDELWIGTTAGLVQYRPEQSPPWVQVDSVNLSAPQGNTVRLTGDRIQDVRLTAGDLSTRQKDLVLLTQLPGVDPAPRPHPGSQIMDYARVRLGAGTHILRVIARDAGFNYSLPVDLEIIVPRLVTLPWGATVRANTLYLMLAAATVVAIALSVTGAAGLRARARGRRLEAEMAARQRAALARDFNPYVSGEPIRDAQMFFGRDELLQRIYNALHQNSIMIHGERRMGKTTLLYQLAEQLRTADDPEWVFVPVYVDLEGTPQHRFFYLLMDTLWGVLQAYLAGNAPALRFAILPPEQYTDREFAVDLRVIVERLKRIVTPRKVRIILLLDEMDVVSSYDPLIQQQLRRIFMSPLAANLGAVVAGIQISKAWDRLESPWYNLFNEIALDPFTEERARELLTEPVRGVYEWEPDAVDFVVRQAEGRPYRLQQYGLAAVDQMLAAGRLRITLADVLAGHEIIERSRADQPA
jgi:ligand-binding sensor domain-containing protein